MKTLDEEQEDRRVSLRQVVSFIVAIPVAAFFVILGLALGAPYKPTTVQMYTIIPDVVCPGDETALRTALTIERPVMGNVETFSVDSTWVAEGRSDRIGIPDTTFSFNEEPLLGVYGKHDIVSPVKRFAPNDPGVWRLETTLTTYGHQILHRVDDVVTGLVSNTVTVLPFSDSRCRVAYGG